jgi:hypothetical protein
MLVELNLNGKDSLIPKSLPDYHLLCYFTLPYLYP